MRWSSPKTIIWSCALVLALGVPAFPAISLETPPGFHREAGPQKFSFLVRHLPSTKRLWITEADIGALPNRGEIASLRVSVLRKPDLSPLLSKEFPFAGGSRLENLGIEGVDLSGGVFTVRGELLDKDGKVVGSEDGRTQIPITDLTSGKYAIAGMVQNAHMPDWVKPYNLVMDEFTAKSYPFAGNRLGMSGALIPPFEAVRVEGHEVRVCGRRYLMGDNALPSRITARQPEPTVGAKEEELLYAPLCLFAVDSDGAAELKPVAPLKVVACGEAAATVEGQGANGWLKASVRNTIAQDGVMKIELKVVPSQKRKLRELYLDIPLRESQATLMHDVTEVVYRRLHRDKKDLEAGLGGQAGFTPLMKREDGVVWDSLETEKDRIAGSFQPMVWLGNEDRGLCWFADSDQGWLLDDHKPALQLFRKNGRVVLRVSFVNREVELDKPLEVTFGLLATPGQAVAGRVALLGFSEVGHHRLGLLQLS